MKNFLARTGLLLTLTARLARADGDLLSRVPSSRKQLTNPYQGTKEGARSGAKLFDRECKACHGSGRSPKAPPLESQHIRKASPGALFWILTNGSLRSGMPSFAHLPAAQRLQIIAYLTRDQE